MRDSRDFLIVGSGIAGLRAAIDAGAGRAACSSSRRPSRPRATPATRRAASPPPSAPTTARRCTRADTMRGRRRAVRRAAVRVLVEEGPRYVRELIEWGARFDRDADGDAGARARGGAQRAPRAARRRRDRPRDRPRAVGARRRRCRRCTTINHALVTELVVEDGRVRRRRATSISDGGRREVRGARDAAGDRRRRPGVPRDDESRRWRPATASRWRITPARASPTSSSCSSIRPRSTCRARRGSCCPRRCAARARGW